MAAANATATPPADPKATPATEKRSPGRPAGQTNGATGEKKNVDNDPRCTMSQIAKFTLADVQPIAKQMEVKGRHVIAAAVAKFKQLTFDEQYAAIEAAKKYFASLPREKPATPAVTVPASK